MLTLALTATLALSPGLSALGTATLLRAHKELGMDAFVSGTGRCPKTAKHCFGIALHVVVVDGKPVRAPPWFARHVEVANQLFAPIDVGFQVVSIDAKDPSVADMVTRRDRDLLGRADHSFGVIHVYVVRRLADVDIEGEEIRGVHWRDRANTQRRWIILSSIGSKMVLAHELGHFFGLPHSKYNVSIMNKTPRPLPVWNKRLFHDAEIAKMLAKRDKMLGDKTLVKRKR